jgi:hypothetical protein
MFTAGQSNEGMKKGLHLLDKQLHKFINIWLKQLTNTFS